MSVFNVENWVCVFWARDTGVGAGVQRRAYNREVGVALALRRGATVIKEVCICVFYCVYFLEGVCLRWLHCSSSISRRSLSPPTQRGWPRSTAATVLLAKMFLTWDLAEETLPTSFILPCLHVWTIRDRGDWRNRIELRSWTQCRRQAAVSIKEQWSV